MRVNRALVVLVFSVGAAAPAWTDEPLGAAGETRRSPVAAEGNDYWFRGKAELARFDIERRRYGELRKGQAVLVFVTEDFLERAQTKLDATLPAGDRKRNVLKLNRVERFATGVYDYSMMTSVFSPMDGGPTIKTTTSIQDWCGQVWAQVNRRRDGYVVEGRSYFQREGDQRAEVAVRWLEDELWNRVRIDPTSLPVGAFELLPSSVDSRLHHYELTARAATGTLDRDNDTWTYRVVIDGGRTLEIRFASAFPHRIDGWTETRNGKLESRGTRRVVEVLDYWNRNGTADADWRGKLDLPTYR